jgi:hypothetical protein
VQKVSKMRLGAVQILPRIFRIFWNLFSFSLSYFYLLEGSKIFFMSSKCFIWIVHVLIYLSEFSWNLCDFSSIFRAFKTISAFSGIVSGIKNKFGKQTTILQERAEPEGLTHSGPPAPTPAQPPGPPRPIGQSRPWQWPPPPGRASLGLPRPRPYKGQRLGPRALP